MFGAINSATSQWVAFALLVICACIGAVLGPYGFWKLWAVPYYRRVVRQGVLSHLVSLARQDLPLATGLTLAADGETGILRRTLKRVASFLARGATVTQAIRTGYPSCPGIALSLIAAGERAGQLPAALIHTQSLLEERDRRRQRVDPSVGPYAILVLSVVVSTIGLLVVFIVPKFDEIFADFGTPLPSSLRWLIGTSTLLTELAVPILIALGAFLIMATYLRLRPRRTPKPYLTSKVADWIRWHAPGLRDAQFSEALAAMIPTLRYALRSGLDLPVAARLAAEVDVNWYARRRMTRFADLLARGREVGRAAGEASLGAVAVTALSGGARCGDLDSALRYVADYHANFVSRWWIMLGDLAGPAVTFAMASIVAFVVLSVFQSLIAVLDGTMDSVGLG